MRRWAAVGVTLGLFVSGACAVLGGESDRCDYPAGAASAFPGTTLEDWVTYGDHAVVLRGEDELERDGREVVRLRTERALWSRPTAPAPAPVETFAGTRRDHDSAAAEPGHHYLLVGAWWDGDRDGNREWVHLELLPFDDGVVGRGSPACRPTSSDADSGRVAVWDTTESEVAELLRRTSPDPDALPFMDLDPADRWQKVAAGR